MSATVGDEPPSHAESGIVKARNASSMNEDDEGQDAFLHGFAGTARSRCLDFG